eukprot:CAMPEP_0205914788 /NCGR_PEP_ID=MMETSP1325-20131115/7448_1 /ASSEMBLY_ACC=CAM_ASM_000708 /TAXON_ID=236786 /ORGANISM="Florenciella sp., Strain RCC1007" /LENGTH=71 /DNA_ID=CAMNT_0053281877 /DNA_START=139 /DNA_END=350 /DNA_ORIENTATION=+
MVPRFAVKLVDRPGLVPGVCGVLSSAAFTGVLSAAFPPSINVLDFPSKVFALPIWPIGSRVVCTSKSSSYS